MNYKVIFREWNGAFIYDVYREESKVLSLYYIKEPSKGELLFDVVEEFKDAKTIEVK